MQDGMTYEQLIRTDNSIYDIEDTYINSLSFLDNKSFNESCHCPMTIYDEETYIIYMTFYGGSAEGENGCGIWFTKLNLKEKKWQKEN